MPDTPSAAQTYGLSDAVKRAVGDLVDRGWTVRPQGFWKRPDGVQTDVPAFVVSAPGREVKCFPSDMLLTGELESMVRYVG